MGVSRVLATGDGGKGCAGMTYTLKIHPEYFEAVQNGSKTFELREEYDKTFAVGDILRLREWDGEAIFECGWLEKYEYHPPTVSEALRMIEARAYTGRECTVEVIYVLRNEQWLQPGVAALGIRLVREDED
jgi:hypothetical protein